MRKLIVSCLASAAVSLAGAASANVGNGSSGGASAIGQDTLGNTPVSMQVPSVQAMFPATAARVSLPGGAVHLPSAGVPEAWGLGPGEQGSTESMLVAGALLVVALIIRRISG